VRIAIYARVSDDKLLDDGSRRQDVQRQVEKLRPMIMAVPGAVIVEPPFLDDGRSAFKDDYQSRPEFCRLLREIRARRVTRVYVESLDRWSRRIEDGLKTLKEAAEYGCTVTSAAEGECDTTTPEGWFKVGVAFLLAEWASRSQSWKVRQGMARRLLQPEKVCVSCGVVHMGRHPGVCGCARCRRRKGRSKLQVDSVVSVGVAGLG